MRWADYSGCRIVIAREDRLEYQRGLTVVSCAVNWSEKSDGWYWRRAYSQICLARSIASCFVAPPSSSHEKARSMDGLWAKRQTDGLASRSKAVLMWPWSDLAGSGKWRPRGAHVLVASRDQS